MGTNILLSKGDKFRTVFSSRMSVWRSEDYKRRNVKGVLVKLDLEETYDKTDWIFLDFILAKKGFGAKWSLGYLIVFPTPTFLSFSMDPLRFFPGLKESSIR